jgi:ABC-2 type transport system permease protein
MTASIRGRSTGFTSGEVFSPIQRMRRVWDYRRILGLLVGRDLRVRYANSLLGYVWAILDPLAMAFVYWWLFTQIITRKVGFPPYILFLVAGQLVWHWINGSITGSVGALRSESQMVRSSHVPRELWVLRVIVSKGTDYLLAMPVLAIFSIAYQKWPTRDIVFVPLAMVMTVALCMGLGMILAPASVLVRDLRSIVRIVMRALFFLSPILYSITDARNRLGGAAEFVSWNPIAGILTLFRATFFPQELNWADVGHSALVIAVIFVIGIWTFNRLERPMLKEI